MTEYKCNVLLVDYDKDSLDLLDATLKYEYNIFKTTSTQEALNILNSQPIELIICEYNMPEMDGIEFFKLSCEINPQTVKILMTADSDANILIEAINKGDIYKYIKKTWDSAKLQKTIKSAVEYHKSKIENNKLIYDLKALFTGTINSIIEALDAKDSFTLGRSRRVTLLALKMAEYFNFSMEETGKLELAGLLHDIGMIGISEEILNKTNTLTAEEFENIKQHVNHSIRILGDIKQLKNVVDIIKHHHERVDGSGYPNNINGKEIPLSSKIISIADAYDSMVSNRSYRSQLPHEEALKRIEEQSGQQFDSEVVEAFKAILPEAIKEIREFESTTVETI